MVEILRNNKLMQTMRHTEREKIKREIEREGERERVNLLKLCHTLFFNHLKNF
jgi:hypothetical protein